MASKWTDEGEGFLRREFRDDRGIDDARSFAGTIAIGNGIIMEAERTDQKGCGWTGTTFRTFASCPIGKLLAAEHGTPHFQLPLTNARFASSDHARNKVQMQNIYTNQSIIMRHTGRYLPSMACSGQSSFIYP